MPYTPFTMFSGPWQAHRKQDVQQTLELSRLDSEPKYTVFSRSCFCHVFRETDASLASTAIVPVLSPSVASWPWRHVELSNLIPPIEVEAEEDLVGLIL